jgi:hypothetical protein
MKRIKLLTALALGVVASSSGVLQVEAAVYNFFVDFSTKEVANFTAYEQSFNVNTYNLKIRAEVEFSGFYRYDSCPTAFTQNIEWYLFSTPSSGSGNTLFIPLPDFVCTTTNTSYFATAITYLPNSFIPFIMNDDASYLDLSTAIIFRNSAAIANRTLSLSTYYFSVDLFYEFGTTYLFNFFLADLRFVQRSSTGAWTFNGTQTNKLAYVYTTAGNDRYQINNTGPGLVGTTRKKYAIDYNDEFFRGSSVGLGYETGITGGTDTLVNNANGTSAAFLGHDSRYFYLNTANLAQAIVDAPLIEFTEENCSGGFLDINVGCYVNNAIAYLVNDAPIISDAFTLLNTGIELAAQTFGIIGNFSDDNVFGYLILVGFGFIAVKWFLKNDE